MPRRPRHDYGGEYYHVLNRSNGRAPIFLLPGDFQAFEVILQRAVQRSSIHLFAYCIMPNHWHLVVRPTQDGAIGPFMHWLTKTHAQKWLVYRERLGTGHLYQGRYRSFAVGDDRHFVTVCRYIERNPVNAGLVSKAEFWRWSSLWHRLHPRECPPDLLADWPFERPADWMEMVNQPITGRELAKLRMSIRHGSPFGPQKVPGTFS